MYSNLNYAMDANNHHCLDENGCKICTDFKPGEQQMAEFFVLPTYSYFGDFQMFNNLRS